MKRQNVSGWDKKKERDRKKMCKAGNDSKQQKITTFALTQKPNVVTDVQSKSPSTVLDDQSPSTSTNDRFLVKTPENQILEQPVHPERSQHNTSSASETCPKTKKSEWYQGNKLDLNWLLNKYQFFIKSIEKVGSRTRPYITCQICKEYEDVAARFSKKGAVAFSRGVMAESTQKLERVVDHVVSKSHVAAAQAKAANDQWIAQSEKHPWIKTLKNHRSQVINQLIHLCIDVYNDSMIETVSARSWPSRSLANMMASSIQAQLQENWEAEITSFQPSQSELHYRDPMIYAEMLHILGDMERKKIGGLISRSLCYSIQIDGSTDRQNRDNKFLICRYALPESPAEIHNAFVGVTQTEEHGAQGLLQAVKVLTDAAGISLQTLIGITTDGEAANTGKNGGLWKILQDHLGHGLLTVWCYCHRSDLAMESAFSTVPELTIWLTNLKSVASYFRTSPSKLKRLQQKCSNYKSFPGYFEVRFAEHVRNLILSILSNLPGCRLFWEEITASSDALRHEKNVATGMLKTWKIDSQQMMLTALMADITLVFQTLQKLFQKSNMILPDILIARDAAMRKLDMLATGPWPGGKEEQLLADISKNFSQNTSDSAATNIGTRNIGNTYVTTGRRNWSAVRQEVVLSFKNFLDVRFNLEEDKTIQNMINLISATSESQMTSAGRPLVENLFGSEEVSNFATCVCDCWPFIQEIQDIDTPDEGTRHANRLRKLIVCTTGVLQKLLVSFLLLSPHSMTTERIISHFNKIKTSGRISLNEDTMNDRLLVSLNGVGTAHFDPRPAVAEFLQKKDRRFREPTFEIYKTRDFISTFFRPDAKL